MYLRTEMHTSPKWYTTEKSKASTYTDKEYDSIKKLLHKDHLLELVY